MDKNEENYIRKHSMQVINNRISIKNGTSFLYHKKFRRLHSHFDEERAIYQAKLLFDEEEEIQGQQMFKRKKINIQFFRLNIVSFNQITPLLNLKLWN